MSNLKSPKTNNYNVIRTACVVFKKRLTYYFRNDEKRWENYTESYYENVLMQCQRTKGLRVNKKN